MKNEYKVRTIREGFENTLNIDKNYINSFENNNTDGNDKLPICTVDGFLSSQSLKIWKKLLIANKKRNKIKGKNRKIITLKTSLSVSKLRY